MSHRRTILTSDHFRLTIDRLCYQLIEMHNQFEDSCIVGIQPRGVLLADRLVKRLRVLSGSERLRYGKLDITFYRDDFRLRETPLKASVTKMEFLVENLNVVLVDDVLYTGRTVQAALTALQHYGRPRSVELLALVDRRFNRHLPIQADFVGTRIDAVDEAYVRVEWEEQDGEDQVLLFPYKHFAEDSEI